MINVKWGMFASIAAFVLALATSLLIGQASPFIALLRALGFAALFFLLGAGTYMLINTYIPELMFPDAQKNVADIFSGGESSGKRVNITLGDTSDAALPGKGDIAHSLNEIEDIADLLSGNIKRKPKRIDQESANDYNGGTDDFVPVPESVAAASDGEGDFSMDFSSFVPAGNKEAETEPQADSMENIFSLGPGQGLSPEDSDIEEPASDMPERRVTGNKPEKFEGDFSPKEIVSGIRTVLEKEKKG